jgi:DNA-binding transcriptional ArsR family regulator
LTVSSTELVFQSKCGENGLDEKHVVDNSAFKPTSASREMIRGILLSPLAERIAKMLFAEFKKDENFHAILQRIREGDFNVKLPGLSFNAICSQSKASRTTVHATLAILLKKYKIVTNEEGYVETQPGKRLAIVYSLRPETIPIMLFLFPSALEENGN